MYLSEMNMEQGSALGEITEIKRGRKLLNSDFLTNILSNVSQNTGREYMQGAQRIDARYLGVVEAASSSLVTQTRRRFVRISSFLLFPLVFSLFRVSKVLITGVWKIGLKCLF